MRKKKCAKCGGKPKLSEESPHYVFCKECWKETSIFAYASEAWKSWNKIQNIRLYEKTR